MASFGKVSRAKLNNLDPRIVRVLERAIITTDFSVLETTRSEEVHNSYIDRGVTKVPYEKTRHKPNKEGKSEAADLKPYPNCAWDDIKRFSFMAGAIMQAAKEEGVELIWGGDWDGDGDFRDQSFHDLPHVQLRRQACPL